MIGLPGHCFAPFVKALGRGKTAHRALTEAEAEDAFGMILDGAATATQIGAFLMLLRMKEETPAELTGMVRAARLRLQGSRAALAVDLDWPSYSGKRQHHPWYLLSALLLASSGHRVLMHGCRPHAADRLFAGEALAALGILPARSLDHAAQELDTRQFSYVELQTLSPALQSLLDLRAEFGLRSPVNTLVRHLDPGHARAGLRSLHHPSYAALHVDSALSLGKTRVAVFRGEGGECELRADADSALALVERDAVRDITLPRARAERSPKPQHPSSGPLLALWNDTVRDAYGLEAVIGTAAVALLAIGTATGADAARAEASRLWERRPPLGSFLR